MALTIAECIQKLPMANGENCFHSAHPTGWAESISGFGVCLSVCVSVITSKMTIISARRLHRPL